MRASGSAPGSVSVNGKVIRTPDHWVDVKRDRVLLDGKPLRELKRVYILLYKPKGYITSYRIRRADRQSTT